MKLLASKKLALSSFMNNIIVYRELTEIIRNQLEFFSIPTINPMTSTRIHLLRMCTTVYILIKMRIVNALNLENSSYFLLRLLPLSSLTTFSLRTLNIHTSVEGPQGPALPISQKLSSMPNGRMWEAGTPRLNHTSRTYSTSTLLKRLTSIFKN